MRERERGVQDPADTPLCEKLTRIIMIEEEKINGYEQYNKRGRKR